MYEKEVVVSKWTSTNAEINCIMAQKHQSQSVNASYAKCNVLK